MVATIKRVPGLYLTAAPGAPSIVPTAEEDRIARLPGLVRYFEPERLSGSPLTGRDRATPGLPLATSVSDYTIGTESDYNNRIVLRKSTDGAALVYDAGMPESFTLIIAADLDAARQAANSTSNLFSVVDGSAISRSFRFTLGSMVFVDNAAVASAPSTGNAVGTIPPGGAPAVWAVSYDAPSRMSRISLNGGTPKSLTHATAPALNSPSARLYLGGSTGSHWKGRIGRGILLDRDYHAEPYTALLAREVAAMRTYYGLV